MQRYPIVASCTRDFCVQPRQGKRRLGIVIEAEIVPAGFLVAAGALSFLTCRELSLVFVLMAILTPCFQPSIANGYVARCRRHMAFATGYGRVCPPQWELRLVVRECEIAPRLHRVARLAAAGHTTGKLPFVNVLMTHRAFGELMPDEPPCALRLNLMILVAFGTSGADMSAPKRETG